MEIKRDTYLHKLIERKHNGLVKIITGVRRCGKSYLLFELFRRHLMQEGVLSGHIITVNFEDFANRDLRKADTLYRTVKERIADELPHYLLLDEVQMLEDFVDVLNGLMRIKNLDIYITGSNARFLSSDIATEFRGRGDQVRIYPLSFAEFFSVYDGSPADAWNEYFLFGGLPDVVARPSFESKTAYLQQLFEELYLADVVNRNKIRDKRSLTDLLHALASSVGSLTNPLKLANTFRSAAKDALTPVTISKYIDFLQDSFLLDKALRFDVKGRKYINTPFKVYFTDLGLRNALLNFRQVEENHIMENIIYNELHIRGFSVDVGVVPVYETRDGKRELLRLEIDFVCNKGSMRYYVQSALNIDDADKSTQEKRPFTHVDDSFKKILVVRNSQPVLRDDSGITTINLYDFLLNQNSLDL